MENADVVKVNYAGLRWARGKSCWCTDKNWSADQEPSPAPSPDGTSEVVLMEADV